MSRLSATSFDIGRSRHRCAATDREFVPGDPIIVALFEDLDAEGVLHRLDFSPEAWDRFRIGTVSLGPIGPPDDPGPERAWGVPERVFASWKSTAGEPGQKKHALLDEGSLLELFESLEDSSDESQLAFRFVLSLVLIRRKLLVHAGAVPADEEGGHARLLVRAKGDPAEIPAMEVVQPPLTPERIAGVAARIDELLKAGAS